MKNIIVKRLLLSGIAAITIASCSEDSNNTSTITSFEKYDAEVLSPVVTVDEFVAGTYTVNFKLDDRQLTDMTVHVGIGSSSTAEEGEDFDLSVHDIEIPAYGGQDGFSVDIIVHDDEVITETDETIYLTLTSDAPSGLQNTEIYVATIKGCEAPDAEYFVGDYELTSTDGAFGGPIFDDQVVTLDAVGGSTRVFEAIYYEALDLGNAAGEWTLQFDGCNQKVIFASADSGLGCSPNFNVELVTTSANGEFSLVDDSEFTVVLTEREEDPATGCGADGTGVITLTFTKVTD